MYTVKESGLLWTVCRSGEPPHVPFCVTDYGTKGESDARAIADALNEREAMRAEVERLRELLGLALPYIPESHLTYSEGDHGKRVYVADEIRKALAAPQEATR